MENIRAVLRLVTFMLVAVLTVFSALLAKWLTFTNESFQRWRNRIIRLFAIASIRIIGLKLTIKGTPPEPPFFLTTNHLSYVDILPLWCSVKGTFIAKSEIKLWPFFGLACKSLGVLFIDRRNGRDIIRVNKRISERHNARQGIILFPEGTTSCGAEVLPFNPPLLFYPARNELPVHHASLSYQTDDPQRPAHHHVCWWGDMTFFDHLFNLMKLKSFKATITFGEKPITCTDRKELADQLQKEIIKNFNPLVSYQDLK